MKYLKLYENVKYEEIYSNEYDNSKSIRLKPSIISNFLKLKYGKNIIRNIYASLKEISILYNEKNFIIKKIKDDYFLVRVIDFKKDDYHSNYYKCDQLNGLKSFLVKNLD